MRKNKTMSFNVSDPHELELLTHAEQINPLTGKAQNFSKYVKRLIEEDINKIKFGNQHVNHSYTSIDNNNELTEGFTNEVKEDLKSFL